MASSRMFMIIAILAVFAPSILATEHMVGDQTGWTQGFDYQTWAQGKSFYVGDSLVFKYTPGNHNVLKVNGTGFQECKADNDTVALTTGNDVIQLSTPGRKWYICGKAKHCESGNQKLSITVLPQSASPAASPSPSPNNPPPSPNTPPPSTNTGTSPFDNIASTCYGLIVAIVATFGMIIF